MLICPMLLFISGFERPLSDNVPRLRESLTPLNDLGFSQEGHYPVQKNTNREGCWSRRYMWTRVHCADQPGNIFTTIYQQCPDTPSVWNKIDHNLSSNPKKPKELNEYWPIALTSLVMKALKKILKDKIISLTSDKPDPLQFAYQAGKGVQNAKLFILDGVDKHLEEPKSHSRLLFADFSSAFNKRQHDILTERLASCFMLPD